ncbi:MAG: DnaJ domain-containing protein [Candidatus Limnocylindrales bacterium]|jgi:curved DNA-binding protein CbpA
MPPRNPFAVLELPLDATTDAIKAAWRRLARQHHPDVASGDQGVERHANRRMAEINAAYHELSDPERRRRHREAAARAARAGQPWEWPGAAAADAESTVPDHRSGRVPQPRTGRPVTARIDTSALMRPRNSTLRPLDRSQLPGLPPRPRPAEDREPPRASTPSGPTRRRPGPNLDGDLPAIADALETRLKFGKFEGLTLADVAELEPTYVDWIVRTIDRDAGLVLAARVVLRYLDRSGAMRRRRLDTAFPRR